MKQTIFSLCLVLSLLSVNALQAQQNQQETPERCATVAVHQARINNNPAQIATDEQFERWMEEKIDEFKNSTRNAPVVVTIPVVVHVIHNGDAIGTNENITESQILSQITVLNEDYRRMAGTNGFNNDPVGADSEIEFCLATVDPNGNPTNGIIRTNLGTNQWQIDPVNDFDNSAKPATYWDPTRYLNLWSANLQDGFLGYAQFPNTSGLSGLPSNSGGASTDGVVINYANFGTKDLDDGSFNLSDPYDLGRTATHEVGHFFGLRHIWGDGDCTADDYCGDTPNAGNSNGGCSSNFSCSSWDMIENYMDYSDDLCMNIFTQDQKTRMLTVLANSPRRMELINSSACSSSGAPNAGFTSSSSSVCPGEFVSFTDLSGGNPTSWSWSFPGGSPSSSTQQNQNVTYNTAGTYNVSLTVTNANGNDTETSNGYVVVSNGANSAFYVEDFETNATDWSANNPDMGTTWAIAAVGGSISGNKAVFMDHFNYSTTGAVDQIFTPSIDLSNSTNTMLEFDHAHRRFSAQYADGLNVYISIDGGNNFIQLLSLAEDGSGNYATGPLSTDAFVPQTADDWCFGGTVGAECFTVNLSAYDGEANAIIAFEAVNDFGNNTYLDNVRLTSSCNGSAPVQVIEEIGDLQVSPNPNAGLFNLEFNATKELDLEIRLYNVLGQVLETSSPGRVNGFYQQSYDISSYPTGIYFLELSDGERSITQKIVRY